MKIIVIEDDKNLNSGICSFLNNNGIATTSAYDGAEGLEKINSEIYDIILSDLHMPKMDGLTLLKELEKSGNAIPIVIMTAFASIENAVSAMKRGAEDYLTKPVSLN